MKFHEAHHLRVLISGYTLFKSNHFTSYKALLELANWLSIFQFAVKNYICTQNSIDSKVPFLKNTYTGCQRDHKKTCQILSNPVYSFDVETTEHFWFF